MALPSRSVLPAEVVALLPEVDRYREVFKQKAVGRRQDGTGSEDRLGNALEGVLITIVCSWLVSQVIVWGGSILGAQLTGFRAMGGSPFRHPLRALQRDDAIRRGSGRRPWAAVYWGAACLLLFTGALRLLALATEHDGVIRFGWER